MKTLLSFFIFLSSLTHVTSASAEIQSQYNIQEEKMYISLDKLHFSNDGIFLLTSQEEWLPIEHLNHDKSGYYLAGSRRLGISFYTARCKNCSHSYSNRMPQPCEECNMSQGFDVDYEDIWDRQS